MFHTHTHAHTHTHLLRNILSNYWCGMHLTCTNNPVKLTGKFRRFGVRNLSEVFSLCPCLKFLEFWCSSKFQKNNGISRLRQQCSVEMKWKRLAGSWLSRLPFREMKNWCRYAELIRLCITTNWQCLRWAVSVSRALPPCFEKKNLNLTSLPKENETCAWDENE